MVATWTLGPALAAQTRSDRSIRLYLGAHEMPLNFTFSFIKKHMCRVLCDTSYALLGLMEKRRERNMGGSGRVRVMYKISYLRDICPRVSFACKFTDAGLI